MTPRVLIGGQVYLAIACALVACASPLHAQPTPSHEPERFGGPAGRQLVDSESRSQAAGAAVAEAAADLGSRLDRNNDPAPLALKRPGDDQAASNSLSVQGTWWGLLGALSLTAALLLAVMWGLQKLSPSAGANVPDGVVEVLGRASLGPRTYGQVVRFGDKVLLLHATPGGCETLAEVDKPSEVERIAALCEQRRPNSATQTFAAALKEAAFRGERPVAARGPLVPRGKPPTIPPHSLRPAAKPPGGRSA